jgi:hypothetical protein
MTVDELGFVVGGRGGGGVESDRFRFRLDRLFPGSSLVSTGRMCFVTTGADLGVWVGVVVVVVAVETGWSRCGMTRFSRSSAGLEIILPDFSQPTTGLFENPGTFLPGEDDGEEEDDVEDEIDEALRERGRSNALAQDRSRSSSSFSSSSSSLS